MKKINSNKQTKTIKLSAASSATAQLRLHQILSAARDVLFHDGYGHLSMRKIASKAELSLGNVQHFFPSKEKLLTALFQHICAQFEDYYQERLSQIKSKDPQKCLIAFFDCLLADAKEVESRALSFEMWALSLRNADAKYELKSIYAHHEEVMCDLMSQVNPEMSKELLVIRALQISALVDGLYVHLTDIKQGSPLYKRIIKDTRKNILRLAIEP